MSKILLAKYNSERDPKFRTSTVITIKNRKKTVIKEPLCPEASLYVENMPISRERLAFVYEGSHLLVEACEKYENGVMINYIEGKTLDEIIAEKSRGNKELLKKEFNRFSELVCGCGLVSFIPSAGFKKIFGDFEFAKPQKCVTFTSLSLYAHNIIVDSEGLYHLTDFDFCFDFTVPVNFILYRALKLLKKRHNFKGIDSSDILDITHDEKKIFRDMEQSFNNYIYNKYSLNETNLINKFLKPQYDVVTKRYHTDGNNHRSYLFYDIGDGFSENYKIEAVSNLHGDSYEVRFNLPPIVGIKRLRFDPIEGIGCEISVKYATADDEPLILKAQNKSKTEGEFDIFHHLDPIYTITLTNELPPIEITINYRMNTIDFETLYKITNEKLQEATSKKGIFGSIFGKK